MNIGKFTKNFFIVIVAMLLIAIFGRVFMMEDNDLLSELRATEGAVSAYKADPENAFFTHKLSEKLTHDGYYSANGFVYIKESGEIQITARYNDSLYGYFDTPETTEFTYTIVDTSTDTVYEGEVVERGEKYMYNYDKLVFKNVEIGEESELLLFLHFEDKYPVEDESKGLLIHHPAQEFKAYKLSKTEKTALEG